MEKFLFLNDEKTDCPVHTPLNQLNVDHQKFDVINNIIELLPPTKEEIICKLLSTAEGRSKLAAAMANPLRTRRDYTSLARQAFFVEPLPEGAIRPLPTGAFPVYDQNIQMINDEDNSSIINLSKSPDSGYQFLGTSKSTLNIAGIQIFLETDQNCIITVEQSNFESFSQGVPASLITLGLSQRSTVDTYNYYTGRNFSITVQAVSSYYRIIVANLSTVLATTYFRLQTSLCPVIWG